MDIVNVVEQYIVNEILVGNQNTKINPDTSLISSGIIDSLALLRLISFVEERFDVTVEDDEVVPENFETLTLIKELVESKKTGT